MDEKPNKQQVAEELNAALETAAARVVHDRTKWDNLVASESPERSALLKELTSFAELWEYFERQKLPLPTEIVEDLSGIENLPIEEQAQQFREINQRLLARVPHADSGNKPRM